MQNSPLLSPQLHQVAPGTVASVFPSVSWGEWTLCLFLASQLLEEEADGEAQAFPTCLGP